MYGFFRLSSRREQRHSVHTHHDGSLESVSDGNSSWGISWVLAQNRNTSWTYDDAGNVLNDDIHNYTYDAESRLIQIDSSAIQYAYDAEGRRIKRTVPVTGGGSVTTFYLYGLTGLMSEFTTMDTGAEQAASDDRLQYRVKDRRMGPRHAGPSPPVL